MFPKIRNECSDKDLDIIRHPGNTDVARSEIDVDERGSKLFLQNSSQPSGAS